MTDDQTSQADELTEMWDAESLKEALEAAPATSSSPADRSNNGGRGSKKGESSVRVDLTETRSDAATKRRGTGRKRSRRNQQLSPPVLILLAALVMIGSFLLVKMLR